MVDSTDLGARLAARGIGPDAYRTLCNVIFPNAKSADAILLAWDYCKARHLDIFKRPVHIVPLYNAEKGVEVESVWPGVGELLTTAHRTGVFAGKTPVAFGPEMEFTFGGMKMTAPEYATCTVYRLVQDERCAFTCDPIYFAEAVGLTREKKGSDVRIPNSMWTKRPHGQLAKCALSAALRLAFPEEIGSDYTAEEMEGQEVAAAAPSIRMEATPQPAASEPRALEHQPAEVADFVKPTEPIPVDAVQTVRRRTRRAEPEPAPAADQPADEPMADAATAQAAAGLEATDSAERPLTTFIRAHDVPARRVALALGKFGAASVEDLTAEQEAQTLAVFSKAYQ